MKLQVRNTAWLDAIQYDNEAEGLDLQVQLDDKPQDPKLVVIPKTNSNPLVVLRQVCIHLDLFQQIFSTSLGRRFCDPHRIRRNDA